MTSSDNETGTVINPPKQTLAGPIPVGGNVATSYGPGKVVEQRLDDGSYVVELGWKLASGSVAKAFLKEDQVEWKKRMFEMTVEERVEQAMTHKREGNDCFAAEDFHKAIQKYELALIFMRQLSRKNTQEEIDSVVLPCINNSSLASIKLENFVNALEYAEKALRLSPDNKKAVYYQVVALRSRGEYKSAIAIVSDALQADPQNKAMRKERTTIRKLVQAERENAKAMFQGIFKEPEDPITPHTDDANLSGHKRNSFSVLGTEGEEDAKHFKSQEEADMVAAAAQATKEQEAATTTDEQEQEKEELTTTQQQDSTTAQQQEPNSEEPTEQTANGHVETPKQVVEAPVESVPDWLVAVAAGAAVFIGVVAVAMAVAKPTSR